MSSSQIDRYWQQYLASREKEFEASEKPAGSFSFGSTLEDAQEIAVLVLAGIKTATGSLLWSYESEGKPLPRAGDFWVITGGADNPICIIRDTDIQIIPYDRVTIDYAIDGGEGDLTLECWRRIYWPYILSECARIDREPSEQIPLVMERFRLEYGEPFEGNTT